MLELKEAIGMDGEIATIAAKNPQLVVITHERPLSKEMRQSLTTAWKMVTQGTALEGVKVVILDNGLQMHIVDDTGEFNEST